MSFTVVTLVLFVASVSASSLGQEKCSWGPSYWCEKYKQAVECNAVEHCRTKVWAVKDEAACDICKLVEPRVRDYLAKNSTQTELVTLAEEACEEIAGPYASECKSIVDQYEPVIMSSILEFLADPQQVCTALGLCDSKKNKQVEAKLIFKPLPLKKQLKTILTPVVLAAKPKAAVVKSKPYKASPECVLCEFVMDKLDSMLKENATEEEIREALDKVCSLLPSSISGECTQFVNQYADAIVAILAQELDPKEVCTALRLCSTQEKHKAMKKPVTLPKSNETCEICETVMSYLKMLLADNDTRQEILNLLKEGCGLLPAQLSSECTAIVTEYGPAVLDLIAEADPHTLCEEIGLCSSAMKKEGKFCFLGASYWCANKQNALECNALKHCAYHVWN